ncbi:MAG: hypothetical protein AAF491_07350 [Verrucomicrobiota bacterium]
MEAWILLGFGAVLLFLLGKYSKRQVAETLQPKEAEGKDELLWRHEKLVLWERQESERLSRQVRLQQNLAVLTDPKDLRVRSGLFFLAEEAREARQRIGTDLSRLELVKTQLERLNSEEGDRPEAIQACVEMAGSQCERLAEVRDEMRPVSQLLIAAEENLPASLKNLTPIHEKLCEARRLLGESPPQWDILTEETDRRIRETLLAGGEPAFRPICEVLLVDGGVSDSLVREEEPGLASRLDDLIGLTEENNRGRDGAEKNSDLLPSSGFAPAETVARSPINGHHGIEMGRPDHESTSVEAPESGSWVLFRSNDVNLWGQEVYRGENARARRLEVLPAWAEWISVRRVDSGEAVYVPVENLSLSHSEAPGSFGFNGSHELFYGARHLGVYSDACPNEVETRFTYGGWGFGHRVGDLEDADESTQASGWAGKEISGDTVFEIALHAELPETSEQDRVFRSTNTSSLTSA